MNVRLILILFVSILLESVVIAYPVTLLTILLASVFMEDDVTLLAFSAGILLDLLTLRLLGLTSLYFLSFIYLGTRYRKKIYEGTFIYRFLYLLLAYTVYSLLFYKNLNLTSFLMTVVFTTGALLTLPRLFPDVGTKKKLAV